MLPTTKKNKNVEEESDSSSLEEEEESGGGEEADEDEEQEAMMKSYHKREPKRSRTEHASFSGLQVEGQEGWQRLPHPTPNQGILHEPISKHILQVAICVDKTADRSEAAVGIK
jgi:hypothetical protein